MHNVPRPRGVPASLPHLALALLAALVASMAVSCGGGGSSKTATPALSADEAGTATVVAAATSTAEALAAARATAQAHFADMKIESAAITDTAPADPAGPLPAFVVSLGLNNQTGNQVLYVTEFRIKLSDGTEHTYGSYRCTNPTAFGAAPGTSNATTTVCSTDREGQTLSSDESAALSKGASVVEGHLIFEGDITSPTYTP